METETLSLQGLNTEALLRLMQDPYDTQEAFNLVRSMVHSDRYKDLYHCFLDGIEADIGLKGLYRNRYVPRFPTNEELLKNPPNSLGRLLADHLIKNKITLEFQGIDLSNIYEKQESYFDYVRLRALRVHDILHVVIDADISPIGEGKVGAFQAAQYGGPFHALTISFITTHVACYQSERLHHWLNEMDAAYQLGTRSTLCYGVPWEDFFAEDIQSLRARFLKRAPPPRAETRPLAGQDHTKTID